LIHGAQAAVAAAKRKQDARSRWITAVALANKNAQILWALMARGEEYRKASKREGVTRVELKVFQPVPLLPFCYHQARDFMHD
jgi:hypothetical protein